MNRDELISESRTLNMPDSWYYLIDGEVSDEPLPADAIPEKAEMICNVVQPDPQQPSWKPFTSNRPATSLNSPAPSEVEDEEEDAESPIPGTTPSQQPAPSFYHILTGENESGPYTLGQLKAMWTNGRITAADQIRGGAEKEWKSVTTMIDTLEACAPVSSFPPPRNDNRTDAIPAKRHGVFYYVFWGTVSLFATLAILGVFLFFFTAFGAGFVTAFRSSQEGHQPTDASVGQTDFNDTATYEHSFNNMPLVPSDSGEVRLFEMQVYYWNDVRKRLVPDYIRVTYARDTFVFYGERDGFFVPLDRAQEFVDHAEKYREWRRQALDEQVSLEKDIGSVPVQVWWGRGDSTRFSSRSNPVTMTCGFFSQGTTRHQMTISFETARDMSNDYITHRLRTIYIDLDGVHALLHGLSRENINRKVEEHLNKLRVQSRFE